MLKISVQSEHFRADAGLINYIERKLNRLERMNDKILDAEVHLKLQDTGSRVQEKTIDVRLRLSGGYIIDRKTSRTFEAATDLSFDSLKRQLVRQKEKQNQFSSVIE